VARGLLRNEHPQKKDRYLIIDELSLTEESGFETMDNHCLKDLKATLLHIPH
jgi:hypothetical protein